MHYTLSNGKRPSAEQNMRPSITRFFDALNMPPDMPRFSRASAAFPKARLPPRLLLLICPFALPRANILIPRSMTIVQCARIGVQVGDGYMMFCHTRMEQVTVWTASSADVPPATGHHTPSPPHVQPCSYLQMTHPHHAVRTRSYLRPPSCPRLRVPLARI